MREITAAIVGALLLGTLLFPESAGERAAWMVKAYRAAMERSAGRG
ncbi:hypothetical protein [Roseomonas chloroacetimidivorans]